MIRQEECRTRIENEITDSYNSKVKQIDESSLSAADKTAAIKKLDDAKASALKFLKTRDSKKWMENDGISADEKMAGIVSEALKGSVNNGNNSSGNGGETPGGFFVWC